MASLAATTAVGAPVGLATVVKTALVMVCVSPEGIPTETMPMMRNQRQSPEVIVAVALVGEVETHRWDYLL